MIGHGKYDAVTEQIRKQLDADGILLIVFKKGEFGATAQIPNYAMDKFPAVLRQIADEAEKDRAKAKTLCEVCHLAPRTKYVVVKKGDKTSKAHCCEECLKCLSLSISSDATYDIVSKEVFDATRDDFVSEEPPQSESRAE